MQPSSPFPFLDSPLLWALLLGTLLASCGGGGGSGGGGDPGPGLNEGSYSIDDFNYVDEHPPGFQPLGEDGYQVLARDELLTILPAQTGQGFPGLARSYQLQEGPDAGYAPILDFGALFPGEDVWAAAAGQLDDDPNRELVVATRTTSRIGIEVVQRMPTGAYERTPVVSIPSPGWSFADVRVTLGNLDADLRDEILVVARSAPFTEPASRGRVWVFDDPEAGAAPLMSFERTAGHADLQALPIDVDGDGTKEVLVGMSGDTTDDGRYSVQLFDLEDGAAQMTLVHGWIYLYSRNDQEFSRAVVGDFDEDGREDVAWVGIARPDGAGNSRTTTTIKLLAYAPDTHWTQYSEFSVIDVSSSPAFQRGSWAVTSFHPALGRTDLAFVYPPSGSSYDYTAFHYDRGVNRWASERAVLDRRSQEGIALGASDVDADGAEEVQFATLTWSLGGSLRRGYIEHGGTAAEIVAQPELSLGAAVGSAGLVPVPVLAPGDLDADGFALQYTGRRFPRLADPIPIVVLSAPPTQSGISQNHDGSESTYSTSETQGTTAGVTTVSSVTYSANLGFDLFGVLGVEGRASLEKGIERTRTVTTQETIVSSYSGPWDQDVIVFQGTLYEAYEYLIVAASDPAAVGTLMTLDIPHQALTYKWTVEYYNQQVEAEDRIGPDVLTHTPGELASYPTRTELRALETGEMHWDYDGVIPVGQGRRAVGRSVSFAHEQATEEQRTVVKSYGGGASLGGDHFGIGGGIDFANAEGATHAVFYQSETTFGASVGDISDPAEYEAWRYNWGFSIQTVGRRATDTNEADGYTSRKHSFQYLRYWVEPSGSGF